MRLARPRYVQHCLARGLAAGSSNAGTLDSISGDDDASQLLGRYSDSWLAQLTDSMTLTTGSKRPRDLVLNGLHIVLAAFLLLMSFLVHGRVPGLSADESAALGFLLFFFLALPALLIGVGTVLWSIFAEAKWMGALAASLVATAILVVMNVWAGLLASLTYFSFGIWTLLHRIRERGLSASSSVTSHEPP